MWHKRPVRWAVKIDRKDRHMVEMLWTSGGGAEATVLQIEGKRA